MPQLVNNLTLAKWSQQFLQLLTEIKPEVSLTSQLPELAFLINSPDSILWHADMRTSDLFFQEIGNPLVPVVANTLGREQLGSFQSGSILEICFLPLSEITDLGPVPSRAFYAAEYFLIQPFGSSECRLVYQQADSAQAEKITYWTVPATTRRLFFNYQRLVAHYVHLNEYKRKTLPVKA